jgi:hypothetical protein
LDSSKELLPRDARKFQEWDVAILEKFSLADVGREEKIVPPVEPVLSEEEKKAKDKEGQEKLLDMIRNIPGGEGLL